MTEQESEKLGFREWTAHYEKEQELQRDQLGELTSNVSTLTADVRTLMDNQKGMFNRINRPTQWGTLVASAALLAVVLGLVTGPMKEEIGDLEDKVAMETNRNIELHIMFNNRQSEQIKTSTANQTNIQWLMLMEQRLNDRIHAGLGQ